MLDKEASDTEVVRAWLRAALPPDDASAGKRAALARHCSVSSQAVSGWLRTGRITKKHLAKAAEFLNHAPIFTTGAIEMRRAPASYSMPLPRPPVPNRKFEDRREVSETDWAVLQAVKLVLPEPELERIKREAERIRRTAAEQIDAAKGSA